MQDVKISVVIPVYNVATLLTRCMEYLVHNTYQNLEIIIVDDGSTDNTADVYSWYKKQDKRIKVIKQKNAGPATARNTGLNAATGDYVHFCDSDDFVDLDYYERMAEAASITDADIVCGGVEKNFYLFPQYHDVRIYSDLSDKIAVTRIYDFCFIWRYIYKRKFLEENKIKFPEGMYVSEDNIFSDITLYKARTLATARDANYHYVMDNPKCLSSTIKTVLKNKKNGSAKDYDDYIRFLADTGMGQLKDDLQKNSKIVKVKKWCTFRRCFYRTIDFMDGSKKWVLFGIPLLYRKVTQRKLKYYLFGMHLWYVK